MNKEITKCKKRSVENRIENCDEGVDRQKNKRGRRTKRDFEKFKS